MLHTLSIENDMKTINAKGMMRVKIMEFFVVSPSDMIAAASSAEVIDGRYKVVV